MTTREAMHQFLVLFVELEKRDRAEECLELLLEVARMSSRNELEVLRWIGKSDTEPSPPPVCSVHDADDVVPGRICGRHLPCPEHA